jgi:hypothetical protein
MVEAARRRLGDRARIELGDLNTYEPAAPVAATTCFNAIYYANDRRELFERVARFTEKKLVFDLNPRESDVAAIRKELRDTGWTSFETRPFLVPQSYALSRPAQALLEAAEHVRPLARALLRRRFTYVCAAWRTPSG